MTPEEQRIGAAIVRHEEVVLCIVCQRERPPKGQMYCEDCWQKARKRMKDEEEA
jgi:predicted amidophosphoribosyltransferase